jgi:hypothetical protein
LCLLLFYYLSHPCEHSPDFARDSHVHAEKPVERRTERGTSVEIEVG